MDLKAELGMEHEMILIERRGLHLCTGLGCCLANPGTVSLFSTVLESWVLENTQSSWILGRSLSPQSLRAELRYPERGAPISYLGDLWWRGALVLLFTVTRILPVDQNLFWRSQESEPSEPGQEHLAGGEGTRQPQFAKGGN